MISIIRLILQFGVRRLIFLANYEKWIKENLYEKNSLRNIDMDKDGITDSFSFKIKNPLYSAYYKRPEIVIDDEKIDPKRIVIRKGGELINMDEWTDEKPLPLIPGESIEIIIRKQGGLEKGKHKIKILNARIKGFDTAMNLEFIDEVKN